MLVKELTKAAYQTMHPKYEISEEYANRLVDTLQEENDIVRIVDPVTRKILYWPGLGKDESNICHECQAVWGRSERCPNCTSLESLKQKQRMFKMEYSNNRVFWVLSRPMSMDGKECVLETVNDVTDGFLAEGGDHGRMSEVLDGLNHLIVTDALTLLYNRRFLDDFNFRLSEIEREGKRLNVAMIDLDDMKDINDTFGHPAGDAVLRDVAGFLKLHYFSCGPHRECYPVRYGGDEFLVIDIGSDYEKFCADVREQYSHMRRVCYFGDMEIPFSLSVGVASSDEFGWNWNTLLDVADKRMYHNKNSH